MFLQVSPDAEARPADPPLTLQLGLVHRVHHHGEHAFLVALGGGAAAVGRGGQVGGAGLGLRDRR